MPRTTQRPYFPGGDLALIDEMMSRSASVQDVIDIAHRWNRTAGEYGENMFGDRHGDSIIIDGDTILRKRDPFQIVTNFRLAVHPNPPWPEGEERYGVVAGMLSEADHFSVDLFRRALDASHQEGYSPTLFSQVYELNTGTIVSTCTMTSSMRCCSTSTKSWPRDLILSRSDLYFPGTAI